MNLPITSSTPSPMPYYRRFNPGASSILYFELPKPRGIFALDTVQSAIEAIVYKSSPVHTGPQPIQELDPTIVIWEN
jgi:hypothetical protein